MTISAAEFMSEQRNPVRVWWYRGWCWACRYGEWVNTAYPHACGYAHMDAGQAADAARAHLRDAHGIGASA